MHMFARTIDIETLRKCLALNISLTEDFDIQNSLDIIRRMDIEPFRKHLFPMLKTGFGFVDHKSMCECATSYVSKFLDFTPAEKEYLELANQGIYRPELLFDIETAEGIRNNPAALFYIVHQRQNERDLLISCLQDNFKKTFNGNVSVLSVEYKDYDRNEPLSVINPRIISDIVFKDAGQKTFRLSLNEETITKTGWCRFADGTNYNVKTGKVRFEKEPEEPNHITLVPKWNL